MSSKVEVSGGGIGLCGILFVLFLALKLGIGNTSIVGWSWWWVFAPLWIPFVLTSAIFLSFFIVALLIVFLNK